MTDQLIIDHSDAVLTITMNRPEKKNALSREMYAGMAEAIRDAQDDSSLRAVIIQGSEDCFTSGNDISDFVNVAPGGKGSPVYDFLKTICYAEKPLIAAVAGYALGGGCELAMSCHIRIASEKAKLGQPEVKLGIVPGYGGTQRLPRLVGRGAALRLLLTGDMIDAAEAHRIGLVDMVTTADTLIETSRALLGAMMSNAPLALAGCIEAVHRGLSTTLEEGCRIESDAFGLLSSTDDMREGMAAFIAKRAPKFNGR